MAGERGGWEPRRRRQSSSGGSSGEENRARPLSFQELDIDATAPTQSLRPASAAIAVTTAFLCCDLNPLVSMSRSITSLANVAVFASKAILAAVLLGGIAGRATAALPKAELAEGLELVVAAAPPLLNYPIMGSLDDRGRLFIGDAGGLDRKSTRLNSSHITLSRMPSSA